jgi:hypothetical protein
MRQLSFKRHRFPPEITSAIRSGSKVNDVAMIMDQENEHEQYAQSHCGKGEEINVYHFSHVLFQERSNDCYTRGLPNSSLTITSCGLEDRAPLSLTRNSRCNMILARIVPLCTLLIVILAGNADSFAQNSGENAADPEERYALKASLQSGRQSAWRVDKVDGRVSLCVHLRDNKIGCSDWSYPAPNGSGPYAIDAGFSQISQLFWVWRIDTQGGIISICYLKVSSSEVSEHKPTCENIDG